MSRGNHGAPKRQQMDGLIRERLTPNGCTVFVIQSRDLDDPEAMRRHLKNIAAAMGRDDLMS